MSEQNKTMTIEELTNQTVSLAGAVAGTHNLFIGVSHHLNLLNEVITRLYKENQELHLKVAELSPAPPVEVPVEQPVEHGWPNSFCVVGRLIMESIKNGMWESHYRVATTGNLDTVAENLSYSSDATWPVIQAANVARKDAVGVFNYGVVDMGEGRKGYTFALCPANMHSADLVFEIGISYRVIEIWAIVTNSQGVRGKVSISSDAFANLLDEFQAGNYRAVYDIVNSFETASLAAAKKQTPQQEPVAEPAPVTTEQGAKPVDDTAIAAMINGLLQKHHQQEGSIRTYQQSIVNANANEPDYWDRNAVIYYNTGTYALGNGEVLVRTKLNDREDLVILCHHVNGKNIYGYYRVDQTKAHAAECDLATVVELLKTVV